MSKNNDWYFFKDIDDHQWQKDENAKIRQHGFCRYINWFGVKTRDSECQINTHGTPIFLDTNSGYTPEYYRGVLEYQQCNEQGEKCGARFDPKQLENITNWIKTQSKPVFVVVYIHGWKHNAASTDDNYVKFSDMLARVSHQLSYKSSKENKYKVLGIYVGWQGNSQEGIFQQLTIKSRACASEVVSNGIHPKECGNLLSDTKVTSNLRDDLSQIQENLEKNDANRLLLIGHSLGGRIVSHLFLPDLKNGEISPLGKNSLITTINAAIGSYEFSALYINSVPISSVNENYKAPTWINITSKGDDATRYIYSAASWVGLVKGHKTIGHDRKYITHDLYSDFWGTYRFNTDEIGEEIKDCKLKGDGNSASPKDGSSFRVKSKWCKEMKTEITFPEIFDGKYKSDKGSTDVQVSSLEITPQYMKNPPLRGRFWNISTDKDFIDFERDKKTISGKHNGYISSKLIAMLVERTLDLNK